MTGRRPDLDDLAMFVHVAKVGSIGQVAGEMHLSQPSVSRRMVALEQALKVSLLNRSPRGSTLTPAGRLVVDWASTLLAAADEFTRSLEGLRTDYESAALRVAVSMTVAEYHAPRWLAALHQLAPGMALSLTVNNSTSVMDLVEGGDADLGFVETPAVRVGLRTRHVGWDRLVVAVPPTHSWATRDRPVSLEELATGGLLVREPGSGTRETLEQALFRQGSRLAPGLVLPSNTALRSAAIAGMGPVVVSALALAGDLTAGHLVLVQVQELDLRRPLSAIWLTDAGLSQGARALLRIAGEAARTGDPG